MSRARTTIKREHDCRYVSEDDYSCRFYGAPRARSFSNKLQHRALVTNFCCSNIDTYEKATADLPHETEEPDHVVPADCFLFCRTHRENAAYECIIGDGQV
jgi:hypothetical protein